MPYASTVILTSILFVFWFVFLNIVLQRKYGRALTYSVQAVSTVAVMIAVTLLPFEDFTIRPLVTIAVTVVTSLVLYHDKWPRTLLACILPIVWMTLAELLSLTVFPAVGSTPGWVGSQTLAFQINLSIVYLGFNLLMLWVSAAVFNRYSRVLSAREWLLYTLFPFSQFLFITLWFRAASTDTPEQTALFQIVSVLVCLVADVALYFAVRGMAQRAELSAEKAILEKQINTQKEHYAALTEQYENVRRMRHDIANHVHTIKALLDSDRNAEAVAYAAELVPHHTFRSSLGSCKNPIVDAFLYGAVEEARQRGIRFATAVALPEYLPVSNAELVSAFGNLVDNAVEACGGLERPTVELTAKINGGYLVIETKNPLPEDGGAKRRRVPELERGVGFHILRELAEKYDGSFAWAMDNGCFCTTLILKVEGEWA